MCQNMNSAGLAPAAFSLAAPASQMVTMVNGSGQPGLVSVPPLMATALPSSHSVAAAPSLLGV